MQRVIATPLCEWRQGQYAGHETHQVVRRARGQERPVRAVVHEDEGADEQAGDWQREEQRNDDRPVERDVDAAHQHGERSQCRRELKRRAPRIRAGVRLDGAAPVRSRGRSERIIQRANFATFSAAGPF